MAIVLIVEDEPLVRAAAQMVLSAAGHTILSASSVPEGLRALESEAAIDVLLTDMNLGNRPEGGGEIGAAVVQSRPAMKIIYTSGRPLPQSVSARIREQDVVLPKPYTAAELVRAMS